MTEGLTDKMWCVHCEASWDQRNDSESLRHCPHPTSHEWVVPVAAVTEAIEELRRDFYGPDAYDKGYDDGWHEAIDAATAAFHFEGDRRGDG